MHHSNQSFCFVRTLNCTEHSIVGHDVCHKSIDDAYFGAAPWPAGSFGTQFNDRPGLAAAAAAGGVVPPGMFPGPGFGVSAGGGGGVFAGPGGVGVPGTFPGGSAMTTGRPRCDGREQDGFRQVNIWFLWN